MKQKTGRRTAIAAGLIGTLVSTLVGVGAAGASAGATRPAMLTGHYSGKWELKARLPRVNVARGIKNLVIRPAVGIAKFGGKAAVGAVNLAANGGKAAASGGKMVYNGWQVYSTVTGKTNALAAVGSAIRAAKSR